MHYTLNGCEIDLANEAWNEGERGQAQWAMVVELLFILRVQSLVYYAALPGWLFYWVFKKGNMH
jgi:hypothetical protein